MSSAASSPAQTPARPVDLPTDPGELEKLIRAQQNQLASSVDALVDKVSPKNVAQRAVAQAKARGRDAVLTPTGEPRVERLAAVGAGVLGVVGLVALRARRRRRRGRRQVEKAVARGRRRAGD